MPNSPNVLQLKKLIVTFNSISDGFKSEVSMVSSTVKFYKVFHSFGYILQCPVQIIQLF